MSALPVPSPCNSVCRIDPASGWCMGCARSLDEIAAWSRMGDEGKRVVWAQLPARREALRQRGLLVLTGKVRA
ncbi:DUF1289 domain-containing protein [uncultured Aquincola sp.]|uniref:DUF1289 domain-containing protein n=1 Tax=uncultured Aquincola sp. TaxID=886556 RepID=UPI0032B11CD9